MEYHVEVPVGFWDARPHSEPASSPFRRSILREFIIGRTYHRFVRGVALVGNFSLELQPNLKTYTGLLVEVELCSSEGHQP